MYYNGTTRHLLFVLIWTTMITGHPAPQQSIGQASLDDSSWQKYVKAPSSKTIAPVSVLQQNTTGNVSNPEGLVGHGSTVLSRTKLSQDMPSVVLDFGQNYAGILSIDFDGAQTAGDTHGLPGITLAFSETLEFLTNRSDFTRSDNQAAADKLTNGTDQIAVELAPYTWTNQLGCQSGKKVCSDGFHGFRYLRITLQALPQDAPATTPLGTVSISSVSLAYSGFYGTPDTFTGWFECSDPDITQWWYDAVYTNDLATDIFLANNTDPRDANSSTLIGKLVLHDGAKRDRDPYVGDLAVSALTSYLSHDAPEAARNVLADLADHQRDDGWIPPASINNYTLQLFDYPLWWVVCSSDLVFYTGDTDYLNTYYANLVKTLDVFYPSATNTTTGLLQKGLGVTDGYGDYAFLPRTGTITYYNALYVLALNRAAQLADIHGEPGHASGWRERAAAVAPALIKENWDASVGALFDGGPCPNATGKCPVHAQDGNSIAILSGATNNAAATDAAGGGTSPEESILSYLSTALTRPYGNAFYDSSILSPDDNFDQRVYAFISYFEIAARFSVNTTSSVSSAYDEIKRLYGWMSTHDPFLTFWEGIGPGGIPYQDGYTSMAHGWSTGIVPVMTNYVLGVTPTGPGFSTWQVRPVVDDGGVLSWARGVVPTPKGDIAVSWQKGNGTSLSLSVTGPAGTRGNVMVPVSGEDAVVLRNGEQLWGKGVGNQGTTYESGRVVVGVDGGGAAHVFSTTG